MMGYMIAACMGLIFGSFASAAIYRLPRGENLLHGRSHCPKCNHILGALDLIPLLSWILAKGKCRYCHTPIAFSYLIHEILLALAFVIIFALYGYTPLTLILCGVALCLLILVVIDLQHYYLPDAVQAPLGLLALLYGYVTTPSILASLWGCCIYAALGISLRMFGQWLKKTEALGWGDVKFFAITGLFLGLDAEKAVIFFLLAGVLGIITSVIWNIRKKGKLFPFGPALAGALFIILLTFSTTYAGYSVSALFLK